jgi:hypothetical protein
MQMWMLLVVGDAFCLAGEDAVAAFVVVAAALVNPWGGDSVTVSLVSASRAGAAAIVGFNC